MDRFEQNPVESGGIELEGIKKTGLGLTSPDFVTACLEGFEPPTFWFVGRRQIASQSDEIVFEFRHSGFSRVVTD